MPSMWDHLYGTLGIPFACKQVGIPLNHNSMRSRCIISLKVRDVLISIHLIFSVLAFPFLCTRIFFSHYLGVEIHVLREGGLYLLRSRASIGHCNVYGFTILYYS